MSETETPQTSKRKRGPRSDIGRIKFNDRDEFALTWIGQQYAIRLDQLQWLLGQMPGEGAQQPDWITETAARNVVTRWMKAGWVEAEQLRAHEPLWIWPTRKGLRKVNLPYNYRDIGQSGMDDLKHLYAINEIRLAHHEQSNTSWVSERQLLQGVQRTKGRDLLHRPDAVAVFPNGGVIAIEAELSTKIAQDLAENLMELVRGEEYLQMRNEYGARRARQMSHGVRSQLTEIWYFGPPRVRKQVQRERARLVQRRDLTVDEADIIFTCWYPLAKTEEEEALEKQEDESAFDLEDGVQEDEEESHEEIRPEAEGNERE